MFKQPVDNRGLHRRVAGGLKRFHKRFSPTAIFTTDNATPTAILPPPTTTTNPINDLPPPNTNTIPATTSAATPATTSLPLLPTVPTIPTANPLTTTTSSTASTTSTTSTSSSQLSVAPTPTLPVTTRQTNAATVNALTQEDLTTQVRVTVTSTHSSTSHTATSLAASPTSATASSSGVGTGVVIGGVVAAIVGVAGIVFAVVYFMRRARSAREEEDPSDFNPDAFRRQSAVLPDEGGSGITRGMNYNHGGARPPTMIERKMASTPVSYNAPPAGNPYGYGGVYNQPSFSPGQIFNGYSPTTANSANPFFSPYGESPIGSPVSMAPYDSAYDAQGNMVSRHPSNASTAILSRQTSTTSRVISDAGPESQYVDMTRSSVTPYQAAQYAEISRRLNTTPPQPLPLASVAEELEHVQEVPLPVPKEVAPLELKPAMSFDDTERLNAQPTPRENAFPESPFADPNMVAEQRQHIPRRDSTDSVLAPPEPLATRITSIPPTLPEITLQRRPFSPVTLEFPVAPSSVHPSPSPFSTSFSIPTPPANAHLPEQSAREPEPALAFAPRGAKRPDTVYTLYDDEDAYGGI